VSEGRALAVVNRVRKPMAKFTPDRLVRVVFAKCEGAECDLAGQSGFWMQMQRVIGDCLCRQTLAYRREIVATSNDWMVDLPGIDAPTRLWVGTADTWAPAEMAECLLRKLSGKATVHPLDALGH
jgi:pimeloyl-ACP methyl ester carboxylesterase